MAGRGRPAHILQLQDPAPPLLGRAPPPVPVHYPIDDPLFAARRLPIHPSTLALEERLGAQHREIEELLHDNEQLAVSHVALKNDLNASQHELHLLAASAAKFKAERDAKVRELYERSLKAEAELRAIEGMREELAQVRSDVQRLKAARDEFVEQLQARKGELARARAENKQADTIAADIEVMRKEIQKGRAAIDFEKKAHADNLEQSQMMENNMITMAREIEKLRAELANTEKRARAAVAAANPGPGYAVNYGNPDMVYGANSYTGTYVVQQATAGGDSQFGATVVPHVQYDFQQTHAHR
ncbi:protein FLX-like 1 [Canna indica]|uniref:Protein FLX-like 1 n=1 Tax=Canna indica TaxID=4628 RepID=A0AAQ3K9R7_9LILI|nr:protein FLX-like 1 [Canna indica]